jgi:hypothetical protein
MTRGRFALILIPCFLSAETYSSAINLTVDMAGEPDTRPQTWGTQGYVVWQIHFSVPPGQRVRILRTYGDFLVWPKGVVPPGTFSGTLLSLHTSSPDALVNTVSTYMADNCFLYIQQATEGTPKRAPFDYTVTYGGLLDESNTLYAKMAVWLNDTGLPIHMEGSWVSVFQVEDGTGILFPFRSPTVRIDRIERMDLKKRPVRDFGR